MSGDDSQDMNDLKWLRLASSRQAEPSTLFSEDFLHLADFLLDFPAYFFANTFGF